MGVFSFKTADDDESVVLNNYDHPNSERPVYFLFPGADMSIKENSYNGDGMFGKIDAYEWLAKINGVGTTREDGIELFCDRERYDAIQYPIKLSYNPNAKYDEIGGRSYDCPFQGLPPNSKYLKALEKGVPEDLIDALEDDFDFAQDDVIDYAIIFNRVRLKGLLGTIDLDEPQDIINLAGQFNMVINEAGAKYLGDIVKYNTLSSIDSFTFSELMGHEGLKHISYIEDNAHTLEQTDSHEHPRPRR